MGSLASHPIVSLLVGALACAASCAVTWSVCELALRSWRRGNELHWTERARRLQPIRSARGRFAIVLMVATLFVGLRLPESALPPWLPLCVVLGAILGCYPVEREVFPTWPYRGWLLFNVLVPLPVVIQVTSAIIAIDWIGPDWDDRAIVIAAGFVGLNAMVAAGALMPVLRWLGILRPATPSLDRVVRDMAARMNVKVRRVSEIRLPVAYAAVDVVQGHILFADAVAREHPEDEVAAIAAHEAAHLTEPRWMLSVRILEKSLTALPWLFVRPVLEHAGIWGLAGVYLVSFGVRRTYLHLSREMEHRADRAATAGEVNPGIYARALERLAFRNLTPVVTNARAAKTHPDIFDRMTAAGAPPEYPKPLPPRGLHWIDVISAVILVAAIVFAVAVEVPGDDAGFVDPDNEPAGF